MDRCVRHARRFVAAAGQRNTSKDLRGQQDLLKSLEHSVQMLRREIIRALRRQQLSFRWSTGETFRPDKHALTGTRSELESFVNCMCYAATRDLGFFELPLLPLAPINQGSDLKEDSSCDPIGLSIRWHDYFGWIVKSRHEIGSSEVSTEVGEGRMPEEWETPEGESSRAIEHYPDGEDEMEE